jgi:hypothetical protein
MSLGELAAGLGRVASREVVEMMIEPQGNPPS